MNALSVLVDQRKNTFIVAANAFDRPFCTCIEQQFIVSVKLQSMKFVVSKTREHKYAFISAS